MDVEDDDQGCLACGWRRNMSESERAEERLSDEFKVDLEPVEIVAWPRPGHKLTKRARQYDELLTIILRYHERGQGLRFRITDANRELMKASSLQGAVQRAGLTGKTVIVRDADGYRYMRLMDARPSRGGGRKAKPPGPKPTAQARPS